jgi:hypothetical protein
MTQDQTPEPLRFVDGPNIYSYVVAMFLAIIVIVMVMFSMSPTANPSLQLQGGEALARAEERLSLVSAITAAVAALLILPLMKWRITTLDFPRREVRVEVRGLPPSTRRIAFSDVAAVEARRNDSVMNEYTQHELVITPRQGKRIRVGTSPTDWGIDAAAEALRAEIA